MVPILLAGVALGSAGVGIKSLMNASESKDKTKSMLTDALNCAEFVSRDSLRQNKKTNARLSDLGKLRSACVTDLMSRYVSTFKQIKDITYKQPNLKNFSIKLDVYNAQKVDEISIDTKKFITNSTLSVTAGSVAAYGAYGMAMSVGAASTGTAITTLSGAAATNATLAWFGGGAVSAGGLGMTAGTAVLGGLVAGPALLVMGMLQAKQAEEALTNAVKQEAEIRLGIEQLLNGIAAASAIENRAKEMHAVTYKVAELFSKKLQLIEGVISQKKCLAIDKIREAEVEHKNKNIVVRFVLWITGRTPNFKKYIQDPKRVPEKFNELIFKGNDPLNYNNFTGDEQNSFQIFTAMGIHLHSLLKSSLLDEDGRLNDESLEVIKSTNKALGYSEV